MIKNIIFDFGDVFINLDKKAPAQALKKMGIPDLDEEMLTLNNNYERGLITSEKLIDTYLEKYPSLTRLSFLSAWNSILLDFPQHRLDWLRTLTSEKKYRLFLLSNTNDLHIEFVIKSMGAIRYEQFRECFEQFYLSQQIKMRKPDLIIYDCVLTQNKLNAKETLFIDDTLVNTAAAAAMDINTWHLEPGQEDVTQLFKIKADLF
ncbi:MAG: HAD family phosphatase [Leeuwenhoekiella sp.]